MKKLFFKLAVAIFVLSLPFKANSSLLELTPNNQSSYDIAAAYWLPDFQKKMQGVTGTGTGGGGTNPDKPNTCAKYTGKNWVSEIPAKHDCKTNYPGFGLICYGPCQCKPQYTIAKQHCQNGQTPNDDKCNNLASGCKDCPSKGGMLGSGWALQAPSCSADRLRTNNDDGCATYFHCCAAGFKATDYPNRAIPYDSNTHKIVEEWPGSPCKKAVNKVCTDFNASYINYNDATKNCTKATDTFGLDCWSCQPCDTNKYKHTDQSCKSSHSGYPNWTINSGDICNYKSSECVCNPNSNCGGYNLNSNNCTFPEAGEECKDGCQSKWKCIRPCPSFAPQPTCKSFEEKSYCPQDSRYYNCVTTCESKLTEQGYKLNQDAYGAVITKNTTLSTANASMLRSVEDFRSIPECSASNRPRPTLTYSSSVTALNGKSLSKLNITLAASSVSVNATTFTDVNLTANNLVADSGRWYFKSSTSSKRDLRANNIRLYGGAGFETSYAYMSIRGLFVWNTSWVWIGNSTVYADYIETITSDSRLEFSGGSTYVYARNTIIGAIENYGGAGVYRRGAVIRVRDSAKWYMSYGNVRMRDGALFCAGYYGKIYFSGTAKGYDRSEFDGCRIYNDKDRTLSYGDWDPSSYTSWSNRGGC